MEVAKADEFKVGDIVFAEQPGYMPWPATLLEKLEHGGLVQYICTNDYMRVSYQKMWPYNHQHKKIIVTKEALEYEDFREAILMTERLKGCSDDDAVDYVWQEMHPGAVHVPKKPADISPVPVPVGAQRQIELDYVHKVRKQSNSLRVETQFVQEINTLRRCLTIGYKDYEAAHAAFEQLLQMPVSQLLLVRNFEGVDSIRQLCRFAPTLEPQTDNGNGNANAAIVIRSQANKLMARFVSCFKRPYTKPDFWSEFTWLSDTYMRYTVEFFPKCG
ncbi:Hypothetical predicted protein [Drosophila guanche]|uniref:Lens epithelium-derived growth factor integrase-binding domain-containing protein n=1 Tax=Drosophila guanche TaxID=7266 RepID=A0A3B0JJT9_DROGU|nr:Hypothetical predicted protein [Drosophila guanche]